MKPFVFAVLSVLLFSCSKNKPAAESKSEVVGILPYKGISKSDIDSIASAIERFYQIKTFVLEENELPEAAFVTIKSSRYRADSIIKIQYRNKPKNTDYVLGLTHNDISVTKRDAAGKIKKPEWKYNDFGIMGLAYCPGNSAIVSDFRLKSKDKALQLGRLRKVALHELGHNLGLPHCPNKNCLMTSAVEKISTIDNEKMQLCEKCSAKLE